MIMSLRNIWGAVEKGLLLLKNPHLRLRESMRVKSLVCLLGSFLILTAPGVVSASDSDAEQQQEERIAKLIQQLGATRYATRERAQAELRKFGFEAFEALDFAQNDDDIEIALRARYLLHSMRIDWTRPGDDPAVQTILKGYEELSSEYRLKRMEALSQLENSSGTEALCRLARYERFPLLAKEAALLVMAQEEPDKVEDRQRRRDTIQKVATGSRRVAMEWLRIYIESRDDLERQAAAWTRMIELEMRLLSDSPEHSSRKIVRNLLHLQISLLSEQGNDLDVAVNRLFDQLDGSGEELLETADYLADLQAWEFVIAMSVKFSGDFEKSALLLYRLAEALLITEHPEQAQETAQLAIRLSLDPRLRYLLGFELQSRGMFEYSRGEFQHVIENEKVGSDIRTGCQLRLAEMLHDQLQDLEAAGILETLVEESAQLPKKKQLGSLVSTKSRMYFFYAEHSRKNKQPDEQLKYLEKAIESDPFDADVLIAMYRLGQTDEGLKHTTRMRIHEAADRFREQIKENPDEATGYNQFAWLIANTEGDYGEALQYSKRALELEPNSAGYLDTLAHCYFAKKDLEQAVKIQAHAVQLEPFSGQIRRAHDFFKAEQKKIGLENKTSS